MASTEETSPPQEAVDALGALHQGEAGGPAAEETKAEETPPADAAPVAEEKAAQPAEGDEKKADKPPPGATATAEDLGISQEDYNKYMHVFTRKAINGRIDLPGFKVLWRLLGEAETSEEVAKMFDDGDKDDNDTIDFPEFVRLYGKWGKPEQERKDGVLQAVEKLFPCKEGGDVELKKIEQLLIKMQNPDGDNMTVVREKSDVTNKDVIHFVKQMDKDGNGLISKAEFVNQMTQHMDKVEG